jgi:hypothetical protein
MHLFFTLLDGNMLNGSCCCIACAGSCIHACVRYLRMYLQKTRQYKRTWAACGFTYCVPFTLMYTYMPTHSKYTYGKHQNKSPGMYSRHKHHIHIHPYTYIPTSHTHIQQMHRRKAFGRPNVRRLRPEMQQPSSRRDSEQPAVSKTCIWRPGYIAKVGWCVFRLSVLVSFMHLCVFICTE